MAKLITTLGAKSADELGLILPHEHVFLDLRQGYPADYAQAAPADVLAMMIPELEKARLAGVTALAEATPASVGRRADILLAVSQAARFPLVVPTGIYREPWVPQWAHEASEEALRDWMVRELSEGIEESGVQAAWIKLSAGDNGLTPAETKILRAAAGAGARTNAVIGSHTIRGRVVRDQLDILEKAGYTPHRFIWIHAQNEPDFTIHLEMAQRGAWIEYDAIGGGQSDAQYIERIQRLLDAGYRDQILLSHDRGWYDAGKPGGGAPRPFTYISESFIPRLREAGIADATIRMLTEANPFRAFAR